MTEKITKEDVEELARKTLKKMDKVICCPNCQTDMTFEVFWFDCWGKPYRMCPKCNKRVYG